MPFTISHIAAVLPISKGKYFSSTALIVGSVAPDFGFYFLLRESKYIGHSLMGGLLFDMPLALLICYLFHNLCRNLLISNLPAQLRSRFSHYVSFDWNRYVQANKLIVLGSLFMGVFSHLFIDQFTHSDGYFVELLPILSEDFSYADIPVYHLLQIVLSIFGLSYVFLFFLRKPQNSNGTHVANSIRSYWPLIITISTVIFFFRIILFSNFNTFWSVVIALMGSVFYAWIITSFLLYYKFLKSSRYAKYIKI